MELKSFDKALDAIGNRKKVSCQVLGGHKVIYQVKVIRDNDKYLGEEHLTVDNKVYDYRDFCFSPSQILFGTWKIED